jgi:hypothetical protein
MSRELSPPRKVCGNVTVRSRIACLLDSSVCLINAELRLSWSELKNYEPSCSICVKKFRVVFALFCRITLLDLATVQINDIIMQINLKEVVFWARVSIEMSEPYVMEDFFVPMYLYNVSDTSYQFKDAQLI